MPGRNFNADQYRFGFNGKEMDNEVSGNGNQYDYGFRIYNPRIGKFLSVDPLTKQYPLLTPYQFASNMPIWAIDLDGLEAKISIYGTGQDKPHFDRESERDVINGLAVVAKAALTNDQFIKVLEDATKSEGSIGYLSVFSHSTSDGIIFDNGLKTRQALMKESRVWKNYKRITTKTLTENENIKFEDRALVVFAGCNSGSLYETAESFSPRSVKAVAVAAEFAYLTGVASIGADGYTSPQGNDNIRTADYNYYLFQKNDDGKIIRTKLGDELTPRMIEKVYNHLNPMTKMEPKSIDNLNVNNDKPKSIKKRG